MVNQSSDHNFLGRQRSVVQCACSSEMNRGPNGSAGIASDGLELLSWKTHLYARFLL